MLAVVLKPVMCCLKVAGNTSMTTMTSRIHAGETTSGTPKMRPAGIPLAHRDGVVGGRSGAERSSLTPQW